MLRSPACALAAQLVKLSLSTTPKPRRIPIEGLANPNPHFILRDAKYREAKYKGASVFNSELKRGSLELLILSVLDGQSRHGYEIGKQLEHRSGGKLEFPVSTLYTILYRMEDREWIKGRWVEKKGQRRRCYYTLTPEGKKVLAKQQREWRDFTAVVNEVIGMSHA